MTDEHESFLNKVRHVFIEDEDGSRPPDADAHDAEVVSPRNKADSVDKMFADIEAEARGPAPATAKTAAPATMAAFAPPTAGPSTPVKIADDVVTADVRKVLKLIEALPAVLTQEQVQPLLKATMDAAGLTQEAIVQQVETGIQQADAGVQAAQNEIQRLEAEREETLARLQKLIEAARTQCQDGVAAQQARVAQYGESKTVLARVRDYLGVPSPTAVQTVTATETKP